MRFFFLNVICALFQKKGKKTRKKEKKVPVFPLYLMTIYRIFVHLVQFFFLFLLLTSFVSFYFHIDVFPTELNENHVCKSKWVPAERWLRQSVIGAIDYWTLEFVKCFIERDCNAPIRPMMARVYIYKVFFVLYKLKIYIIEFLKWLAFSWWGHSLVFFSGLIQHHFHSFLMYFAYSVFVIAGIWHFSIKCMYCTINKHTKHHMTKPIVSSLPKTKTKNKQKN